MLKFSAIKGQGNSRFGQRGRLEPTTPGNWGCVHVVSVLFAYFGLVSPLSLWGIFKMIARLQLAHQGLQNLRLEALNVDRFTPRTIDQATKCGAYLSAYERQRLKTLFFAMLGDDFFTMYRFDTLSFSCSVEVRTAHIRVFPKMNCLVPAAEAILVCG